MSSKNVSDFARMVDFTTRLVDGLKYKSVKLNQQNIDYLEAGEGPVILFVHGIGGINAQWRHWLTHFKKSYRVIAVTIPDFTLTLNFDARRHYSFRHYAQWLGDFLDVINIDKVNLVGHCTGACVSAFYASLNADRVQSLTLISVPEIRTTDSESVINVFEREDVVDVQSGKELKTVLDKMFFDSPKLPLFILSRIAARLVENRNNIEHVLSDLSNSSSILLKRMQLIEAPTLIVGGEDDSFLSSMEIFHFLHNNIQHSELYLLAECGHFPIYEQQEACVNRVEQHIERHVQSREYLSWA